MLDYDYRGKQWSVNNASVPNATTTCIIVIPHIWHVERDRDFTQSCDINVTGCRHFFQLHSYTGSAFIWSLGVSKKFCLLKNVLTMKC